MNLTYKGSLAEARMKFSSTTTVVETGGADDPFYAFSVYMPKSKAVANIATWAEDAERLTATRPVLYQCTADNFQEIMTGALKSQWTPVFREESNFETSVLVIVFDDTADPVATEYGVTHAALEAAFNALFHLSFVKVLFDEAHDGVPDADSEEPNRYFDFSLVLACLCAANTKLSWFLSMVRVTYNIDTKEANSTDRCWVVYADKAAHLTGLTDVTDAGQRARYYWQCLYRWNCENTTVLVHSEAVNLIPLIFAAWFGGKNSSGTYLGNKLSMLLLSGTQIKALGFPSDIDASINENDSAHQSQLDDMCVGYLRTISDASNTKCCLSAMRGVSGKPLSMVMIAKYVDYRSSNETAELLTAQSTLTAPKLTDEATYREIQGIVRRNLGKFSATNGRIYGVSMKFPVFQTAKTGRTKFQAAQAWSGMYKDDLDEVAVSGGLTNE